MLYWKICHVYTWFELLFDVVDVVDDVVATTRRQRLTQLIILNTQIQIDTSTSVSVSTAALYSA